MQVSLIQYEARLALHIRYIVLIALGHGSSSWRLPRDTIVILLS